MENFKGNNNFIQAYSMPDIYLSSENILKWLPRIVSQKTKAQLNLRLDSGDLITH